MRQRGAGGFQRAGRVGAAGAGLPKSLTRKLELEAAWRHVAGPALAERVRAAQIRQGVLELAVDDPAWARQVVPLLPMLAAKLARAAGGLAVRKFRVTVGGEVRIPPTPTPAAEGDEPGGVDQAAGARGSGAANDPKEPSTDPVRRLAQVAERCLAAAEQRRKRPPRA